jgi:transcriptional regulator with XRE-family HTH domain
MTDGADNSKDFARAFGDALLNFLKINGIDQSEAAKQLGLGAEGKARLNTYCHDSTKGKRPRPNAEVLYLLCVKLGFEFEYNGYKISAATLNGNGAKPTAKQSEQLLLDYDGQFDLIGANGVVGTVSASFKRSPSQVELTVSLKAAS